MRVPRDVVTESEQETSRVAGALAAGLRAGDVVLLHGDLGAGKTAFVRGMAPALGIDPDQVSSPTFALVQPHTGTTVTLHHVDLYRLDGDAADDLGLEELAANGVLVVEWAERWRTAPAGAIHVWIEALGDDRRRIRITRAPDGR